MSVVDLLKTHIFIFTRPIIRIVQGMNSLL